MENNRNDKKSLNEDLFVEVFLTVFFAAIIVLHFLYYFVLKEK
jgi:hypothetical protein